MVRFKIFQAHSQCSFVIFFGLFQVAQFTLYHAQFKVNRHEINVLGSKLLQFNAKNSFVVFLGLLQIPQFTLYIAQLIESMHDSNFLGSKLF